MSEKIHVTYIQDSIASQMSWYLSTHSTVTQGFCFYVLYILHTFTFDKRKFTFSHNFKKSEFYIDCVSSYFHFVSSLVSVKASYTPSWSLTASPTSQRPGTTRNNKVLNKHVQTINPHRS
jgi:hypothetical protein